MSKLKRTISGECGKHVAVTTEGGVKHPSGVSSTFQSVYVKQEPIELYETSTLDNASSEVDVQDDSQAFDMLEVQVEGGDSRPNTPEFCSVYVKQEPDYSDETMAVDDTLSTEVGTRLRSVKEVNVDLPIVEIETDQDICTRKQVDGPLLRNLLQKGMAAPKNTNEFQERLKGHTRGHSYLWEIIAASLKSLGSYERSAEQCKNRIYNLKKKYFQLKREWQPGEELPTWKYWNSFQKLFGSRPMDSPAYLLDSMAEENDMGHRLVCHDDEMVANQPDPSRLVETCRLDSSSSNQSTPGPSRQATPDPTSGSGSSTSSESSDEDAPLSTRLRSKATKKRKIDDVQMNAQILEMLRTAQERDDAWRKSSDARDLEFLSILRDISKAMQQIADRSS